MVGRNPSIDLIKVIAMFMIVAMHTNIDSIIKEDVFTRFVGSSCGIAIPLFFMVNGFLVSSKDVNFNYIGKKIFGISKFVIQIIAIFLFMRYLIEDKASISDLYLWFIQKGSFWYFWFLGAMIILYLLSPLLNRIIHSKIAYYCLGVLVCFCFVAFVLNVFYGFEQNMIQTFLIWEWCMFYIAGGLIRVKYESNTLPKVSMWLLLLIIILYRFLYSLCGIGNQFLFGSGLCLFYSFLLFVLILRLKVPKCYTGGGKYFLPVYTFHIGIVHFLSQASMFTDFPPLIQYVLYFVVVSFFSILVSYILLRTHIGSYLFKL